jgi:6-phosphogluconolactonase
MNFSTFGFNTLGCLLATTVSNVNLIASLAFCLSLISFTEITRAQEIDVWIGSGGPAGIHQFKLDTDQAKMSSPSVAAKIPGSGFITLHPNGNVLYSTGRDGKENIVAAFRIDRSGAQPTLTKINSQPIGDGGAACIATDKTGRVLISAQYGGGSVATFPINEDGSLGERASLVEHGAGSGVDKRRQKDSHPHWTGTSPDNRFVCVPDLGKDAVVVYELDIENASLAKHAEVAVPPGSGPRHMKFHTSGKFAYVLNELKLTISCFAYNSETGKFKNTQLIETLPVELKDDYLNAAAEIRVHPTGKFVYASNRGHDSIAVFSVDQESGKLTFIEREHVRGSWPRNFCLDPSGNWLIAGGQHSNTVALFKVDVKSGKLAYTRSVVNAPSPICILFDSQE